MLTFQEWALRVENLTNPWEFETFPGDLAEPPGPVWIHADDFAIEWGFEGNLSPGPLEASTFQFALTCQTAADVPEIDYGDELAVQFSQPDGTALTRDPGTGTVTGDYGPNIVGRSFWVTDITAQESDGGRMLVSITASGAVSDYGLSVSDFLALTLDTGTGLPFTDWQSFANSVVPDFPNMPEAVKACFFLTQWIGADADGPWNYILNSSVEGWRGCALKIEDGITLRELLDGTHVFAFAPAGAQGRARGFALVWDTAQVSGDPGKYIVSYPWDPEVTAGFGGVWELTYTASVLDAELVADFDASAADATLGILSACWIEAAPEWRKDAAGAVGFAVYKGQTRPAGSPATDGELSFVQYDLTGPAVRTLESDVAYLANSLEPALAFGAYGGLATANRILLADSPNDWVSDSYRVMPRYMSDEQWSVLGPLFWPVAERQITLVLADMDPDTNMTGGDTPVWLTLTGAKFEIDDGDLVITPSTRPYFPPAINDVTDAVTWAELEAAYPAATWAQVADGLTWAQVKLTSI